MRSKVFVIALIGILPIIVSNSQAVVTLADVEVLESGEFRNLSIGEQVFYNNNNPGNKYRWLTLPNPLDTGTLDFWFNDYDSSKATSVEYGLIDFNIFSDGPVWLLVTTRFGGGGSGGTWEQELTTQAELETDGWTQIVSGIRDSRDGVNPDLEYVLYERDCLSGEQFHLRTEKYVAPIPLIGVIPEPATLLLLGLGAVVLRRKR